MKSNPLIISLLVGLIVVLVIGGVSVSVKMNSISRIYKKELAKNISLEKNVEDLKIENDNLKKAIEALNVNMENLKKENEKLLQLNKTLEDSRKEGSTKKTAGEE
ncbi:MAG: hypothetical protein KBB01_04535 [Candidatus Omnitrophica bacterium]|jgi:predicted RNase H-like nuclease (RuvC/YqgF family)|nr:hypothetical protein [Candidatus Omnitrophota bacterium]